MMKLRLFVLSALLYVLSTTSIYAQIDFIGSAGLLSTNPDSCIEITPEETNAMGYVYSLETLELTEIVELEFDIFVGDDDLGADGLVFVIHNDPRGFNAQGCGGQGLGYGTNLMGSAECVGRSPITPSMGIEVDIFDNALGLDFDDPSADHLAYVQNGDLDHGSTDLSDMNNGHIFSTNIEDNNTHIFRFEWDPADDSLKVFWDGTLRIKRKVDLPTLLGTTNPIWGFTGATGNRVNQLFFCSNDGITLTDPLPISLFSFEAEVKEQRVVLYWQTLSELNNAYFSIEKSRDALHFEEILRVESAGNSSSLRSYQAFDENPEIGLNYYRLRQTDQDGSSKVFQIIAIDYQPGGPARVEVFPNPSSSQNNFYISLKNMDREGIHLQMQNAFGIIIFEEFYEELPESLEMPAKPLAAGIYILNVRNRQQTITKKIIIE